MMREGVVRGILTVHAPLDELPRDGNHAFRFAGDLIESGRGEVDGIFANARPGKTAR